MTYRSLRALPCSTRITIRVLSMSSTLSELISDVQSRAIGDAQRRLVLEAGCRIQQARHLPRAQDDRKLPRVADEGQTDDDVRLAQRHPEEKPQRGHSV